MSLSLFDITVPNYLQTLDGVMGFVAKGRADLEEQGMSAEEIVGLRLIDDMWALDMQLVAVAHHSAGAMRAVLSGNFAPPQGPFPTALDDLVAHVQAARDEIAALDADAINARLGETLIFHLGEMKIPFATENYVMSFSLPNLHFHATTAYDLLRKAGVPLGKRDFTGPLRIQR